MIYEVLVQFVVYKNEKTDYDDYEDSDGNTIFDIFDSYLSTEFKKINLIYRESEYSTGSKNYEFSITFDITDTIDTKTVVDITRDTINKSYKYFNMVYSFIDDKDDPNVNTLTKFVNGGGWRFKVGLGNVPLSEPQKKKIEAVVLTDKIIPRNDVIIQVKFV